MTAILIIHLLIGLVSAFVRYRLNSLVRQNPLAFHFISDYMLLIVCGASTVIGLIMDLKIIGEMRIYEQ